MRWILIICALTACGKKAAEQAGEKLATDFVVNGAKEDLPKIKAAIASLKPTDGMFQCAATMANLDKLKVADKVLGAQFEELCSHDMWAAQVKVSVDKAEAARKLKPDEKVLEECFDADLEQARDELTKAKTLDDATKALLDRFKKACPDAK